MNYTQTAGEKSTVKLTITFSEEEWQEALNKSYLKVRGKYSVPGFRKGKVPKPVLENYYGKGVLFEEAFNYLYTGNYPVILEKEKENFIAVGEPRLDVEDMQEGKGVVLSAVVPVKPEVTIDAYKGLKIKKFEYNVSDADVEQEVKKLLERNAAEVEVKDRACAMGDTVNIDFSGSVDGEKFPGGTAEGYELTLGSGAFIPGFEEGVVGLQIGETRAINVKFPDDYQADNLRSKNAVFDIKLHSIKAKNLPELTDEFVKAHSGSETVADFKQKAFDRLKKQAEDKSRDDTENSILDEIKNHTKVEIPDAMIERETDRIVQEFSYRLMYQGLKLEDYLEYMKLSMEDFRAQFATEANRRVMSQLIIEKLIKTENITASDSEVDAKIAEQAASIDKTFEEYKKTIQENQVEYIKNDIIVSKLFDLLTSNNEMYVESK